MSDETSRFEQEVVLTVTDQGKVTIKMFDRINVDDVFVHLVNRELFRLVTGEDNGADVAGQFVDFLLRDRFVGGQT